MWFTKRLAVFLTIGFVCVSVWAAPPVGWRTDWTGSYAGAQPPTEWSKDKNVLWKTKLPGSSYGSPIVVGKRIFVVSDPAELICLNEDDGKILWQRTVALEELFDAETAAKIVADFKRLKDDAARLQRDLGKAGDEDAKRDIKKQLDAVNKETDDLKKKHPMPPGLDGRNTGNTAATPTCDGKHVFALFGNGIACAFTVDGDRVWARYVEDSKMGFGHSSSPVLIDGKLLVHVKDLIALDPKTGDTIWQAALSSQHATPLPVKIGSTTAVIDPSGTVVRVADGKVLLKDGSLTSSEQTLIQHEGVIYSVEGKARAMRLVAKGDDAVKVEHLWESRLAGGRRTPSAVLHDGLIYAPTTEGILDVLDATTGEAAYQHRLNIGEIYSSATAAGSYLFLSSTKGTTIVLEPGKEYHEVARNQLEGFGTCPVFSGSRMYVRTGQHLYCIGK